MVEAGLVVVGFTGVAVGFAVVVVAFGLVGATGFVTAGLDIVVLITYLAVGATLTG